MLTFNETHYEIHVYDGDHLQEVTIEHSITKAIEKGKAWEKKGFKVWIREVII
jgi:hypothetical protein